MPDSCLRWGGLMKISSARPSGSSARALSISPPLCRRVSLKGSAIGPSRHLPATPSRGVGPFGSLPRVCGHPSIFKQPLSEGLPSIDHPGGLLGKSSKCAQNGHSRTRFRGRKIIKPKHCLANVLGEGVVERSQYGALRPSFNDPFPSIRAL